MSPAPLDFVRPGLPPRQRALFRAFAEALYDDPARPPSPTQLDRLVLEVDDFVGHVSRTQKRNLIVLFDAFRFVAPLFVGRPFSAFEDLAVADRVTALERLDASRFFVFPLLLAALKVIVTMNFLEDEAGLAWLGYRGERERHKRLPILPVPPSESQPVEAKSAA